VADVEVVGRAGRVIELIQKILPDKVASAEAFDDPPDVVLYPGEAEVISRAVDKRRREFRTVRHCAPAWMTAGVSSFR